MTVEETNPAEFTIKDLSFSELALIQEALISYEATILPNADEFQPEKVSCTEMACAIDHQLIKSKS